MRVVNVLRREESNDSSAKHNLAPSKNAKPIGTSIRKNVRVSSRTHGRQLLTGTVRDNGEIVVGHYKTLCPSLTSMVMCLSLITKAELRDTSKSENSTTQIAKSMVK